MKYLKKNKSDFQAQKNEPLCIKYAGYRFDKGLKAVTEIDHNSVLIDKKTFYDIYDSIDVLIKKEKQFKLIEDTLKKEQEK
jgi:hypothetical protein